MANPDNTRVLPPAPWADPRGQLLEDTWLLTIFAVLLATAFPWFVSAFNIDFAAASWALLALGAVYVCMSLCSGARRFAPRTQRRLLGLLNAAGIIAMACVWQRAGALQNPAFLLAFVLPVIGAGSMSRWQPYLSALLAVLLVAGVSLSEDPELSWYAAGRSVARLLVSGQSGAGANGAFLGFYAPVAYDLVLLEVFAILAFACAVAAETINNSFSKLLEHLHGARADAAIGQEMWAGLMQRLPLPALLVDAESLEVLQVSDQAAGFCRGEASAVPGRELFEAVQFSCPEPIQSLIAGAGGSMQAMAVRVGGDLRIADVRVEHMPNDGRRLALVLLLDASAAFCVAAALDVNEQAVFVMDARGKLLLSNRPARMLFPDGLPALATASAATGGWGPGASGRRRLRVTLGRRNYQALCTSVALAGEPEELCVVALSPAPAASSLPSGGTMTDKVVSLPR
jgi:hypothetical protein